MIDYRDASVRERLVRLIWGGRRETTEGRFERAMRRLGKALCGLTGHRWIPKYEPDRLSLECQRCGESTPGWRVEARKR